MKLRRLILNQTLRPKDLVEAVAGQQQSNYNNDGSAALDLAFQSQGVETYRASRPTDL